MSAEKQNPQFESFVRSMVRDIEFGIGLRRRVFLWWPQRLASGRWAWLCRVEQSVNLYEDSNIRAKIVYEKVL